MGGFEYSLWWGFEYSHWWFWTAVNQWWCWNGVSDLLKCVLNMWFLGWLGIKTSWDGDGDGSLTLMMVMVIGRLYENDWWGLRVRHTNQIKKPGGISSLQCAHCAVMMAIGRWYKNVHGGVRHNEKYFCGICFEKSNTVTPSRLGVNRGATLCLFEERVWQDWSNLGHCFIAKI